MPKFISKSRMDAQKYHEQAMETSNRMIRDAETGWSWLFGPSGQEMANVSRATEAEQYALDQARKVEQLPTLVAGADAAARMAGARPQDLNPTQRGSYGINMAQQIMAGRDPAAVAAGNPLLNPAVVESAQREQQQQHFQNLLAARQDMRQQATAESQQDRNRAQMVAAGLTNEAAQRAAELGNLSFNDALQLQTTLDVYGGAVEGFQTLNSLIDAFPNAISLANNPDAMGTAVAQSMRLLPAMALLAGSGTLNDGEREFFSDFERDPSSVISRLASNDKRTKATYNGIIRQLEQRRGSLVNLAGRYGASKAIDASVAASPFEVPKGAGPRVDATGRPETEKPVRDVMPLGDFQGF